eukprot:m.1673799 g.1673799  ORF g.1673799 m.1673799 type:complete len:60 (+) comp178299_c0_seq1:146-325(+)
MDIESQTEYSTMFLRHFNKSMERSTFYTNVRDYNTARCEGSPAHLQRTHCEPALTSLVN